MRFYDYDPGESDDVTSVAFRRVVLEKIRLSIGLIVDRSILDSIHINRVKMFENIAHFLSERFIIEFRALGNKPPVTTRRVESSELVPRDWWQHVKQRFAPGWFKRRWPVEERRILTAIVYETHILNVCPHLPLNERNDHEVHLIWMEEKDKGRHFEPEASSSSSATGDISGED